MTVTTADPIRHRADCLGVDLFETVGARGDTLLRCRSCARFAVVGGPADARPVAAPVRPVDPPVVLEPRPPRRARREAALSAAESAPILSRYRCAHHPDQPVSFHGRDCPKCQRERRAPARTRNNQNRNNQKENPNV